MSGDLPSVMDIRSGAIWCAAIQVAGEAEGQVRYHFLDAGGRPLGRELALAQAVFERRFAGGPQGRRLRLRVVEVERGSVLYQELDAAGEPLDDGKRCSLVLFVRNFQPETAG